jgi:hypothetical protein
MHGGASANVQQNKVGDKFLGEDGETSWEIISKRQGGGFIVKTTWGSKPVVREYSISAQKINALCNAGRLKRVK